MDPHQPEALDHGVTKRTVWIDVADGTRLCADLYLPGAGADAGGGAPWPAVLEALPYRKDDITAAYRPSYVRLAAAGFAVCRLDVRGTGSSGGIATDEYPDVERDDLRAVIGWLAAQPWSSGRVGMFGASYSGFNSLHMACEGVPALSAIVAFYATDDRYTDDVHWCGGVLRAIDLVDYVHYMVPMNALPPVPALWTEGHGGDWRSEWRRRIDETPPWLFEWLRAQGDAPMWRRGSVRLGPGGAGYERISCPTMIVAGWADGYRNNTFRVVQHLRMPWRLLAGPWSHKDPATSRPGPHVDADAEVIAFFDEHLRGGPSSAAHPVQVFVRHATAPEPDQPMSEGVWRDLPTWPPPGLSWRALAAPSGPDVDELAVRGDVGAAAWISCAGGLPWGQPTDVRGDDAWSLTYDWPVDDELAAADLMGNASVALRVRASAAAAHVSVKLVDVFPDGTAALITRGMLDLARRGCWPEAPHGRPGAAPQPLVPGEWVDAEIELEATAYRLAPGHTLRLSIAGSDWPNCWPPPAPVTLTVDRAALRVRLPLVSGAALSSHRFGAGRGPSDDDAEGVVWRIEHDVLGRETRVVTRYGGEYEGTHGARIADAYDGTLGVSTRDPGRAWARGTVSLAITWPGIDTCRTVSTIDVRSDANAWHVAIELVATEGDREVGRRSWRESIPRRSG
jgi:hypothetical protein